MSTSLMNSLILFLLSYFEKINLSEQFCAGPFSSSDITIVFILSFFAYYNKILEDEILKKKIKIIQSQYEGIEKNKKVKKVINMNVNDLDVNLLRKKEKKGKHMNLDNYVKKKKKKVKKKVHLPKKQNFD